MSSKVSTSIDERLVQKASREAVRQGRQLSEILEEALDHYLVARGAPRGGVVAASWGVIPLDAEAVQRLLDEEDDLLDA